MNLVYFWNSEPAQHFPVERSSDPFMSFNVNVNVNILSDIDINFFWHWHWQTFLSMHWQVDIDRSSHWQIDMLTYRQTFLSLNALTRWHWQVDTLKSLSVSTCQCNFPCQWNTSSELTLSDILIQVWTVCDGAVKWYSGTTNPRLNDPASGH